MSQYSAKHLLYSLVSGIIALFFLLLGVMAILVAMIPGMRTEVVHFILTDTFFLTLFGLVLVLIGFGLLIDIFYRLKKQTYHIKRGQHSSEVEEEVIQSYVNQYWKELFPDHEVSSNVSVKKNRVIIEAELPLPNPSEQKVVLERVQKDLDEVLYRFLGYREEYLLSITFQPKS